MVKAQLQRNQKNLKTALENTCKHRESEKVLKQIPEIILTIKDSENLKEQWKKYSKKMPYAADISFEQVVEKIEDLLKLITDGEKKQNEQYTKIKIPRVQWGMGREKIL